MNEEITILVGMNESGKTSALEAIAKTNYFQDDVQFEFNLTHDYPRKEKKAIDKSGENPKAITCTYKIDEGLLKNITVDIGSNVLKSAAFSISTRYKNDRLIGGLTADKKKFIENKTKEIGILSNALTEKLMKVSTPNEFDELAATYKDESYVAGLKAIKNISNLRLSRIQSKSTYIPFIWLRIYQSFCTMTNTSPSPRGSVLKNWKPIN